jgi:Transposase DDE domain
MNSRVHPIYKTKYRVANWPEYERSLVRRRDVALWLSSEAVSAWKPARDCRRGGQRKYSDLAIETALTLRLVYGLPLRQAEGFLTSVFRMMGVNLEVPDHTTLSRRSQHLDVQTSPCPDWQPHPVDHRQHRPKGLVLSQHDAYLTRITNTMTLKGGRLLADLAEALAV